MKPSRAIRKLKNNAHNGNVSSMYELYQLYSLGQDTEIDAQQAAEYLNQCLTYLDDDSNKLLLETLQLIDFRKFPLLDIEFESDLTVFIGDNGAGKTTIVDAIAKIFSWVIGRLVTSSKNGKPVINSDINNSCQQFAEIFSSITLGQTTQYQGSLAKAIKGAEHEKSSQLLNFKALSDLYRVINDVQRRNAEVEINLPVFVYYSVKRSHPKTNQSFDIEKLIDIDTSSRFDVYDQSAFDGGGNFEAFLEWYVVLDNLVNAPTTDKTEDLETQIIVLEAMATDNKHPLWGTLQEKQQALAALNAKQRSNKKQHWQKMQQQIKHAIVAIVPSISDLHVVLVEGRKQVKVINDNIDLNVLQASDGQRVLLAMVADLARRMVMLNPQMPVPLHSQGIVLIDEIELHLHPKWQQGIIQSLQDTFVNIQFIVTTHSPQVLSTVDKRCIRQFYRDNEQDKLMQPKFQTRGVASADILERIMDTHSVPEVFEHQQVNQFYRLLQDNKKQEAEALLETLKKHFSAAQGENHPVIDDCLNQMAIDEMKQQMRKRKNSKDAE